MKQSRFWSAIETKVDVGIGALGSWLLTLFAMPMFGFSPSPAQAGSVVAMYTVWAIIRKYTIRRLFEWLRWR